MPIPIDQKLVHVAITERDRLLRRNLLLSDTVIQYGSTAMAVGNGSYIDKPAPIGLASDNVIASTDITVNGELYRNVNSNLIYNRYNNSSTTKDLLGSVIFDNSYLKSRLPEYDKSDIDKNLLTNSETSRNNLIIHNQFRKYDELIKYTNPIGNIQNYDPTNESYIDKNGALAGSSKFELAGNIIGSVLNGQGVGFSPQGVEPNYDIRTTMAGRVLGMTGAINDTPLGKAAQKGLAFAMLNNVAFHAQQEVGGMLNLNITNMLSGGNVIVPNNDITVPKSGIGKATDLLQKLSGFEVPRSFLPEEASIFSFNDKLQFKSYNRSQSIIDNTGKGQQIALFYNLNANLLLGNEKNKISKENGYGEVGSYGPTYTPSKDGITYEGSGTDVISYPTKSDLYLGLNDVGTNTDICEYTWPGDSGNGLIDGSLTNFTPKSLLSKTQYLFKGKDKKANTMINSLSANGINAYSDEISTVIDQKLLSKGNAVINSDGKTFCRTWSTLKRYEQVQNLQKHRGLDNGSKDSVLDANGFVRIGPTHGEGGQTDMKRFMFSLENLAWSDSLESLKECEKGPDNGGGDGLKDGKRGRIMWFPPYNLTFSDTSSVNWETNEFIGRGEPIYTYNNTERSGQLSFKIITDHSSAYNKYRHEHNDVINRFIFGCETLPAVALQNISTVTKDELDVKKAKNENVTTKVDETTINLSPLEFYFPNDISETPDTRLYSEKYEVSGTGDGIGEYIGDYSFSAFTNKTDTGLNIPFYSGIDKFVEEIKKNTSVVIKIQGYASSHGTTAFNAKLSSDRAKNMAKYLSVKYGIPSGQITKVIDGGVIPVTTLDYDVTEAKLARKCNITITNDPTKSEQKSDPIIEKGSDKDNSSLNSAVLDGLFCESGYFQYLQDSDPISYAKITGSIKDQIKFFQPAFHSITPEGFNSRLNFLLQCTRQGPTIGKDKSSTPNNLAFGKPPVCILRIGDFYHTKIIIDTVDFSFNEVQWDLNPDGIGVQPMIVDVSISFKFIGGSSLNGPIAKLQNAVSFNFFANTEMYDERADKIRDGKLEPGKFTKTGDKPNIETTNKEPLNTDQVVDNEKTNSGEDAQSESTPNDVDSKVLSGMKFSLTDTIYNKNDGTLKVKLEVYGSDILSKEYHGQVVVKNNTTLYSEQIKNNVNDYSETSNRIIIKANGISTESFDGEISLLSDTTYGITVYWDDVKKTTKSITIKTPSN